MSTPTPEQVAIEACASVLPETHRQAEIAFHAGKPCSDCVPFANAIRADRDALLTELEGLAQEWGNSFVEEEQASQVDPLIFQVMTECASQLRAFIQRKRGQA